MKNRSPSPPPALRARTVAPGLSTIAALTFLLAGCGGSSPESAPAPGAPDAAAASAEPSPTAVPASIVADVDGWLAGSKITVTAAAYDADLSTVTLDLTVENTANTDTLEGGAAEYISLDVGEGTPLSNPSISSVAVASSTTKLSVEFLGVLTAPVWEESALVLGGPGYETWRLPLAEGASGDGIEPFEARFAGVADAGGLSFTAERIQVLPWACESVDDYGPGESGRYWFEPSREGEAAVVVWGDIHEAVSIWGGDTPLAASLTLPDGTVAPQIGTVYTVFDVNEGIADYPLCFTVERPVDGAYTLTWSSYRGAVATLPFEIDGAD